MLERANLQPSELHRIHAASSQNYAALLPAGCELASCFHCLSSFHPEEITGWVGEGGWDAVCPRCHVDSVVPSTALDVEGWTRNEVLVAMKGYWFDRGTKWMSRGRVTSLFQLQWRSYATAARNGFWDRRPDGTEPTVPEKLMLICCEISEAMEEWRKGPGHVDYVKDGKPEGIAVELADAVIRILDLAQRLDVDLADVIRRKMEYNDTRPFKHGKHA
jgi:NTP pyrophosphatase (non-canonical NTP hydrolase)